MTEALGERLIALTEGAQQELLLVAPYIKAATLARILSSCAQQVLVRVVTRWRLEEIATGVSDVDVWPLLRDRGRSELWLQPSLHAKYYRADSRIAIGSANLTGAGLGWSCAPNLEILEDITSLRHKMRLFETSLWRGATQVNEDLYQTFCEALAAFPTRPSPTVELHHVEASISDFTSWRPCLRFPENLYQYYSGDHEILTSAAKEAAAIDLAALSPPARLTETEFRAWIATQLRQHPELQAIDLHGQAPRRFGEMRQLLAERGAPEPTRAWQTWMRWLEHFLPSRYIFYVANYSEIFRVTPPS